MSFGNTFSGTNLLERSIDGVSLTLSGGWSYSASLDVAVDMFWGEVHALDVSAIGVLSATLAPKLQLTAACVDSGVVTQLTKPVKRVFGGMMGPVRIWVEVTLTLSGGYCFDSEFLGTVGTTLEATKETTVAIRLREGRWTNDFSSPPITFGMQPAAVTNKGNASLTVYVQPKIEALVYSLAGLSVDMKPYAEMTCKYELVPDLKYERAIYFGLSSSLATSKGSAKEATNICCPDGVVLAVLGMPRPLWIAYGGARYHVMGRGNRGASVFKTDADCDLFLETLAEAVERTSEQRGCRRTRITRSPADRRVG